MSQPASLRTLFTQRADMDVNPSPKGWYKLSCRVCNDHEHKKRAGFRFDGSVTEYNCFNCRTRFHFDEADVDAFISDELKKVCEAYHVDLKDVRALAMHAKRHGGKRTANQPVVKTAYPTIELPSFFVPYDKWPKSDPWVQVAIAHLEVERKIDPSDYPFYMAFPEPDDPKEIKQWAKRLIIPYYDDENNLIFYQGRDLTDGQNMRAKYKSPDGVDKPMCGLDHIHQMPSTSPLYVVEGFFDAYHLKGVGILGNELTKEKVTVLSKTRRPKVYIPDRLGDGHVAAMQAIRAGWSVALPDIGSCKDVGEAIAKYGVLYVARSIADNTYSGKTAEVRVSLWCVKSEKRQAK